MHLDVSHDTSVFAADARWDWWKNTAAVSKGIFLKSAEMLRDLMRTATNLVVPAFGSPRAAASKLIGVSRSIR